MKHSSSLRYSNYSFLLTFILIFLANSVFPQSQPVLDYIDSLNRAETDFERMELYNYISFDLREEGFYEKARTFADSALIIADKINNLKGRATALRRIGEVYDDIPEKKLAVTYYDSAYRQSEAIGDIGGQARCANQLSLALNGLGSFKKAVENGYLAIQYFQIEKDDDGVSTAMNNLANAYSSLAEYDSSIIYFNKALAIAVKEKDSADIADIYLNLGVIYQRLDNYDKAIEYAQMSQAVAEKGKGRAFREAESKALSNLGNSYHKRKEYDKAEALYIKARDIKISNGMPEKVAPELNGLGLVAKARKDWDAAEAFYLRSFQLSDSLERTNAYVPLLNLGLANRKNGKLNEAIDYYEQAYKRIDSLGIIKRNPEVLTALSELYEAVDQTEKALEFSRLAEKVRDDINRDLRRVDIVEEEIAEAERERERAEELQAREALKNKQLWIIIIALIVILGLLAFNFYTRNKNSKLKAANLQKDKEQAEQDKKINTLIKSQEINTISARMEGQEKERTRIAQDLHDRLGGMLSVVRLNFQSFEESLEAMKEKNIKQFTQASELLNEACDEVRRIAHDMTSGVLVDFGLVAAVTDLKAAVESAEELKVNLNEYGMDDRLEYDYEINAYRIIQELLTNTLKHAQANEINIQLLRKGENLSIVVDDDGQGFDPDNVNEDGMGLSGIKNRVAQFDGTISIDSGKGAGTTVTIDLPIKKVTL